MVGGLGMALGAAGSAAFLPVQALAVTRGAMSGESVRVNLSPSVQLPEVDEEALIQLSVPAELAQKVLRVLEKRCQGSAQCDLRGSHIYAKYFLGREAEQDSAGSSTVSSEGAGCGSAGPEAAAAKATKEDLCAAPAPPRAPAALAKSDSQLFSELLEREGLLFPEVTEEQIEGSHPLRAGARARCRRRLCCGPGGRVWAGHGRPGAQSLLVSGLLCVLGVWVRGTREVARGVIAALTPAPPPPSLQCWAAPRG